LTFLDQNFVAFFLIFPFVLSSIPVEWMPLSLRIQEAHGSNLGAVTRYPDCSYQWLSLFPQDKGRDSTSE
jgi:hypothetical protein